MISRVNIDYEYELFDPRYNFNSKSYKKINEELEYLFFWMGDEKQSFYSLKKYPEDYLNFIKNMRGILPGITPKKADSNWWGLLNDVENERILNSKLTSTKMAIENCWAHPETSIVSSLKDIEACLSKSRYHRWILKDPYQFSGRGMIFFDIEKWKDDHFKKVLEEKLAQSQLIFDPNLKRTLDIGVTFYGNNFERNFVVQNYNNKMGAFKGGFLETSSSEFMPTVKAMKPIVEAYKKLGAKDILEIDSFTYLEDGLLKPYLLVEVNYRKTMGLVIHNLMEQFKIETGCFILINKGKVKKFSFFDELLNILNHTLFDGKQGCIPLSPVGNNFMAIFIAGDHRKDIQFKIKEIWKLISLPGEKMPLEFVINF